MIKDNQKVFNRLMVVADAAITAASLMSAYFFKFYILNDGPGVGVLPAGDYLMLLPFLVPMYMLLYYANDVYSPKRTVRRRNFWHYQGEYHRNHGINYYIIYDHP